MTPAAFGSKAQWFIAKYRTETGQEPPSSVYALYGVQALQVILAAIERSGGSRKGVRDAVFTGAGLTIPESEAILGRMLRIEPSTGDVNITDVSILQIVSGKEAYRKQVSLQ
jgi:branched-chain amino acid transport system substrate-binding protein